MPESGDPPTDRTTDRIAQVRRLFERSIALQQEVAARHAPAIVEIGTLIGDALVRGGKVLFCGNGGSAADAQHLAAELLVRLRPRVDREALPALSLAADPSSLTAWANDYGYDGYFARMVTALGVAGDVLVGITTSGRSPSVVRAMEAARARQMLVVGLLGGEGEPALSVCDLAILVPSDETGRVQESHIVIGHAVLEIAEEIWLARDR